MNREKQTLFKIVSTALIALYCLSLMLLFIWALYSSFKARFDFLENKLGLPKEWKLINYAKAFNVLKVIVVLNSGGTRDVFIHEMFLYSVIYAGGAALISTASQLVTAYCVAKYKFKLGKIIYGIVIIVLILPIIGNLPSMLQLLRTLKLYNTLIGVYMMKGGFTGVYFLVFYAIFEQLPASYSEAAEIDGASHFTIFFKIMLPLVMSTVVGVYILLLIGFWNEYETILLYLPAMPTVSYGLFQFQFSLSQDLTIPILLAGCLISCIPMFAVFMLFKKQIITNISMGGIKG